MKITVDIHDFRKAFMAIRPDNFSWEGLGALFTYLDEIEEGKDEELDVIAICTEFSQYPTAIDVAPECDNEDEALDFLRDRTSLIEFAGGIIIQDF